MDYSCRLLFSMLLIIALSLPSSGVTASRESFCEQCEAAKSREKPGTACECQAYCCSTGYEFSDASICGKVLSKEGKPACDDPCEHCKGESSANGAKDSCFSSCCEFDVFSQSCKMWKFDSTLEVTVTGSKHIVLAGSSAAKVKEAARSSIEKRIAASDNGKSVIEALAAKKSPKICSMTSECSNYCDAHNSPPTPVRSVCVIPDDLNTLVQGRSTCAGWGCHEATQEHAEEGCFCCCSSYRGAMNKDKCEISSSFGSCIQFCASHKRNLMPLSCLAGSGDRCGGETCVEVSDTAGADGCFCCCAE